MRHRTNSEIKAYVDGYTACFNQYSECLKNRKSVLDSKKKMEIYLAAVTGVLEATGNATNADRIRSMSDEELARFMWNRDIDIVEKAAKATGFTYTVDMEKCFENVLNWLKQEAADKDGEA